MSDIHEAMYLGINLKVKLLSFLTFLKLNFYKRVCEMFPIKMSIEICAKIHRVWCHFNPKNVRNMLVKVSLVANKK